MLWDRPVLMTYGYQNHAVQTDRWRYINTATAARSCTTI